MNQWSKQWIGIAISTTQILYASNEIGLLGGQTFNGHDYYPYAGVLEQTLQLTNVLSPSLLSGEIASVALNQSGVGLIGGSDNNYSAPYAAILSPNAQLTPLFDSSSTGSIEWVSLNNSGDGIICGSVAAAAYLALVSPTGVLTPSTLPSNVTVNVVAISDSGKALAGGDLSGSASYLAAVASDGALTEIPLTASGYVSSVTINASSVALVSVATNTPYAAIVNADNSVKELTLPTSSGTITSVAINRFGTGLLAGYLSSTPYAAIVSANGEVAEISALSSGVSGYFSTCALNDANMGLVGGNSAAEQLIAFYISADGSTTSLALPSTTNGRIRSVAINQAGVGLIGGLFSEGSESYNYAALVAPNGVVTPLTNLSSPSPEALGINSVAIIDAITPTSAGSYASAAYSQLAAAAALETHFLKTGANSTKTANPIALMASAKPSQVIRSSQAAQPPKNVLWAVPIFNYVHIQAQGKIPTYDNTVGGILLGYDRTIDNLLVGAGFGYAFNYAAYTQGIGHSKINEELGCLYTIYHNDYLRINSALWGGGYQLNNERHALSTTTSYSKAHGWILSPHFEIAFPLGIGQGYRMEPFAMFDWVNNWQSGYSETGASGFNLTLKAIYNSLLQSQIGLRFYEQIQRKNGIWSFEQKLCYVNQAPFNVHNTNTFFTAGAAAAFPVATGSSSLQNLGDLQLFGSYFPYNVRYPYVALMAETMLGTSYQSYFTSIELGRRF